VWLVTDGLPKLVKLWGQWNAALLGWMVQIAPELAKGLGKMALELSAVFPRIIAKIAPEFAKFGVSMGKAAANGIIDQINAAFDRIANMAKGPLGGLLPNIDVPNIPYLAKGGIVSPTPGGMLSIIGEAGRSERVEPLDPSGMSKRDRALIDQIVKARGGAAREGIVFNIYPSQGMNEIELANVISRKVAWNLRIGA
jgi:hypothetical protein